jgi:crotonobetainyl-CoA:carnitine CoA-transferase CaiB-like acyl-CoA transferase
MRQAGATVGPIYNIADAMADPHFAEREIIVAAEDETFGTLPMQDIVPKMSGTPGVWRLPAPELGQHNADVLGEAGLSAAEIAAAGAP